MTHRRRSGHNAWRWLLGLWAAGFAAAAMAGVLTAVRDEAVAYSEQAPALGALLDLVPPYPDTYFYAMGQCLSVDGFTREMAYGLTNDAPRKVADRYEAIWNSQGFKVERQVRDEEESVTATALGDSYMRTVVATRAGGRTTILASVRELFELPRGPESPVPRFCKVVSQTGGRDQGVLTEMVFVSCEGYLRELVDFYDGALHGTTRVDRLHGEGGDDTVHVTYSGAELEVMLTASQAQLEPPRATASITWQERR